MLPDRFGSLRSLTHLNLAHNGLRHLPETIGKCRRLRVLNAAMNRIKAVPEGLGVLKRLVKLDLSHNDIKASAAIAWRPPLGCNPLTPSQIGRAHV